MYKANKRHLQPLLVSNVNQLAAQKRTLLEQSWAGDFYRDFFCRIKEEVFAVLYVDYPSRPNVPVNWLVGLETLKAGFGWSDEELYQHFCFDIQVRYALGLQDLNEGDFDLRTLYYFRERLSRYNLQHGVNLLTQAFEEITDQQLETLNVKTGRQRMDSTQIASDILDASRLQLLVEAVQRLYRTLSAADQERYGKELTPYLQGHAGQFVYRIKGKEATDEQIQKMGQLMARLVGELQSGYGETSAYQLLVRFFQDNFQVKEQHMVAKTSQELEAGCLQSCDDLEATFRRKGHREYKGYVANLSETCDPDNPLQLITQVQVAPNNVNDSTLLAESLPHLKERTGVEILHTDGAFACETVDRLLRQHQVEQIQSGIHGRELKPDQMALCDFDIQVTQEGQPQQITCPQGQTTTVTRPRQKGFRADFDPLICQSCPLHTACLARPGKRHLVFRLTFLPSEWTVAQRRRKMLANRQVSTNHRAAVEGTVRELKHAFPASKLPVRGLFRIASMILSAAAMTNIRRIHHYWERIRQDERQLKRTNQKQNRSAEPGNISFSMDWKSLLSSLLSSFRLPAFVFGC